MNQLNPYKIFPNVPKDSLEDMPCSILSLGIALAYHGKAVNDLGVKCDKYGYCQLRNMDVAIKKHFRVEKYKYYVPKDRKKLGEFTCFPGNYIVCVKGHYVFIHDDEYYSFFDNGNDEVVAWWSIEDEITKPKR